MLFYDSLTHPLILLNLMLFWGALNPFHSGIGSSSIRVEWLKTDKRRWIKDELSGSEVLKCNSLSLLPSLPFPCNSTTLFICGHSSPPPLLYRRRTQRMCLSNRLNRPEATQNPVMHSSFHVLLCSSSGIQQQTLPSSTQPEFNICEPERRVFNIKI